VIEIPLLLLAPLLELGTVAPELLAPLLLLAPLQRPPLAELQ